MNEILFYYDKKGNSDVVNYLDELSNKSKKSKTDNINFVKIMGYINILSEKGTRVGSPIIKHIQGDIWELRPLKNRIFFFYFRENKYVLLHHFTKKSNKTPQREIEKAKNKRNDFIERFGKEWVK